MAIVDKLRNSPSNESHIVKIIRVSIITNIEKIINLILLLNFNIYYFL